MWVGSDQCAWRFRSLEATDWQGKVSYHFPLQSGHWWADGVTIGLSIIKMVVCGPNWNAVSGFLESLMSAGTFSPLASKEQSLLTSLAAPQSSREESGVRRKIRVNFGLRCGWPTLIHCSKARRRTCERISRRQGQGTWVEERWGWTQKYGMVDWMLIAECTNRRLVFWVFFCDYY
jgi:hypothetical protein